MRVRHDIKRFLVFPHQEQGRESRRRRASGLSMHGYFTKGTCFVMMPIGKGLDGIHYNIIKPTVEKLNFICRREDEYPSIGILSAGVVSHIANASFIIADLTDDNPNVYYELGIAHTLEKVVILLSQDSAPSDIRHWKYLSYLDRADQALVLANNLRAAIRQALDTGVVRSTARATPR